MLNSNRKFHGKDNICARSWMSSSSWKQHMQRHKNKEEKKESGREGKEKAVL